jgi:hypothetical protein
VREDFEGILESGVQGIPKFYVNGVHHDGSHGLETLQAVIEATRGLAATPEVQPVRAGRRAAVQVRRHRDRDRKRRVRWK